MSASSWLEAQPVQGEIRGQVKDASEGVIVGAQVIATETDTNLAFTAETGSEGLYSLLHLSFAGFGIQRPNLVGDPELPSSERSTAAWFNTAAFAVAPQFTLGSSSRNPVRGPAYRNLDLAFIRREYFGGGDKNIEIRVEIFNVTNTPPFGAPNAVFGSPGFGSITSAGDPRVIQLGLKLGF